MNNKIEPCYCSFEQCKLLKEKGFNVMPHYIENKTDYILGYNFDLEDKYDYLKTREFQFEDHVCSHLYLMPEQWQVIEWLRVNHNIWIYTWYSSINMTFRVWYQYLNTKGKDTSPNEISLNKICNTPQKAYSAAFDYILINLI